MAMEIWLLVRLRRSGQPVAGLSCARRRIAKAKVASRIRMGSFYSVVGLLACPFRVRQNDRRALLALAGRDAYPTNAFTSNRARPSSTPFVQIPSRFMDDPTISASAAR